MIHADWLLWKALACALGFLLALAGVRLWKRGASRAALALHAGAALLGLLVFFNFGAVRHAHDLTYVNQSELFHYQLGAKYFPELGYDGLYLASFLAERESWPERAVSPRIRDLRTNRFVEIAPHPSELREVRARFTPERWAAFRADHDYYVGALSARLTARARRDHGFNPSPTWTFVARLFAAPLSATRGQLLLLANLDLLLMAAAFFAVLRSFGPRAALLCMALFGLSYGIRYVMQGAFLRLDWLAAVLAGVCALKRERAGLAGAAFGYATAVRLFPVVFLAGAAAVGLGQWLRRERPIWLARLVAGFAATLLAAFVAGSFSGRGVAAWNEFASNIELHRVSWGPTRIGFEMLIVNGPESVRDAIARGGLPRPPIPYREVAKARLAERFPAALPFKLALVGLLAAALWRARPWEGAVLGLVALYTLSAPTSYYWIVLCAAPLARTSPGVLAALAISAPLYALNRWAYLGVDMIHMRFTWASLAVGLVLLMWLLPDARSALRELRHAARSRRC